MSKALTKPQWQSGPYKAYSGESTNGWWVILDNEGDEIGSTDSGFEFAEAHLFAAAPDLYEALELLVDTNESGGWPSAAIVIARAALAKAKGEWAVNNTSRLAQACGFHGPQSVPLDKLHEVAADRIRRLEALVEWAYREGWQDGYEAKRLGLSDSEQETVKDWTASDAKRALEESNE